MALNFIVNRNVFLVVCVFMALAVRGQVVTETFPVSKISESFELINPVWEQANNQDKFYIFEKGAYYLHRRHKSKPGFIFPDKQGDVPSFELEVKLQLQKHTNKSQAAGLVFMAQENSSGALMAEVNQNKEFRLLKWNGKGFEYLSGGGKKSGWVRTKAIASTQKAVVLKVRSANRKYDVYINNQYVTTFAELTFKQGKVGLIIEPDTKVEVEYFNLNISKDTATSIQNQPISTDSSTNDEILTQVIIKLRAQLNEKDQSIELLQQQLLDCSEALNNKMDQSGGSGYDEAELLEIKKKLAKVEIEREELEIRVNKLMEFQESIKQYEDGDIIIGLSEVISKEKAKNDKLSKENQQLTDDKRDLLNKIEEMQKELEKLRFELNLIEE